MHIVFGILMVAARFLYFPIFLIVYPAVRGYNGAPIHWIIWWIPITAIISAAIDVEIAKVTSRERQGFLGTLGSILFVAALKLIVFVPVGAVSFFGAAALSR